MTRPKRKLAQTDLEVPDSDDEDYGWAEEDDGAIPFVPRRGQGSEDLLLGHDLGYSDEHAVYDAEDAHESDSEAEKHDLGED